MTLVNESRMLVRSGSCLTVTLVAGAGVGRGIEVVGWDVVSDVVSSVKVVGVKDVPCNTQRAAS